MGGQRHYATKNKPARLDSLPQRRLEAIDGSNWESFVQSRWAVLMLGKTDCEHCIAYTEELHAFLETDATYGDVRFGKILLDRTPGSEALHERAVKSLPNGVASNFQANDPYPTYLRKGQGSKVWDVDGNEYVDFHGGFGVNVVGHAHPTIVKAIRDVADQGIHFAVTTESTVALAEAICERFELEQMRFVNSGTEATMDAIRVARAATGRDKIVKMEGSYHGHHDSVLFSVVPEADVLDMRFNTGAKGQAWYTTQPTSKGVPEAHIYYDKFTTTADE